MKNEDKDKSQIVQGLDAGFIAKLIPIQIALGDQEFPPLRIIPDDLFRDFLRQELKKLKPLLSEQDRALFNCWFTFFMKGHRLRPRQIPPLESIFYPDQYLKKHRNAVYDTFDTFHQFTDREIKKEEARLGKKIKDPVIRAYACFGRSAENKSIGDCFRYTLNYPPLNYSGKALNKTLDELVNLSDKVNERLSSQEIRSEITKINIQIKMHPEKFIQRPKELNGLEARKEQIFNRIFRECWKDYLENLGKRFQNEEEKWEYLRNIRKGLENMYLAFLDKTANAFAERLKPHLMEEEINLFKLFYCRQEIFGERILYYDVVEQGLLRGEDLYKFGIGLLAILVKVFNIKEMGGYNLEKSLNRAIKVYLTLIGSKRMHTKIDETWLKKQLKERKSTVSIDEVKEDKNGRPISRNLEDSGPNPEEQYQKIENREYLKKLIKKYCTPKEQEVLFLNLSDYRISEIAQQTGRTKSTIQELKDTGIKRIQKGLGKL